MRRRWKREQCCVGGVMGVCVGGVGVWEGIMKIILDRKSTVIKGSEAEKIW